MSTSVQVFVRGIRTGPSPIKIPTNMMNICVGSNVDKKMKKCVCIIDVGQKDDSAGSILRARFYIIVSISSRLSFENSISSPRFWKIGKS